MTGRIPGFSSTGSKRPDALFGPEPTGDLPLRMTSATGCRIRGESGREYVDYVMGLGAVALGYGHPEVTAAIGRAAEAGVVGGLAPALEEATAGALQRAVPWMEQVRFLKTGAEAVAAAVRIARTFTGRDRVLGCGYHGWLDWSQPAGSAGVPAAVSALFGAIPFNDADRTARTIRAVGDALAAVCVEPVIEAAPDPEWLAVLRTETRRVGAVLIFDEVKTVGRVALGGAAERWGGEPDLVVVGKAIANGMPLAAVGGRLAVMRAATATWISSTLATEFVSLAACEATLGVLRRDSAPARLGAVGGALFAGLEALAARHPTVVAGVAGLPEMCFLRLRDEAASAALARGMAARGYLWKRTAYNFVCLAHDPAVVAATLEALDGVLADLR